MVYTPMTSRTYEVKADVNAAIVIRREIALDLQLLLQVRFKLGVYIVNDRLEAVLLVDLITIPDRVYNGELEPDIALLQLISMRFELDGWQIMWTRSGLEARIEERIHESRFPKSGLACRGKESLSEPT